MKKEIRFGKVSMIDGVAQLEFKTVETDDTLQLIYKEIGNSCNCIDIPFVSREYAKRRIDLILNDEGKLIAEERQVITGLIIDFANTDNEYRPEVIDYIVGNYLLMSHDEDGEIISLTDEQVEYIKNSFTVLPTQDGLLSIISV